MDKKAGDVTAYWRLWYHRQAHLQSLRTYIERPIVCTPATYWRPTQTAAAAAAAAAEAAAAAAATAASILIAHLSTVAVGVSGHDCRGKHGRTRRVMLLLLRVALRCDGTDDLEAHGIILILHRVRELRNSSTYTRSSSTFSLLSVSGEKTLRSIVTLSLWLQATSLFYFRVVSVSGFATCNVHSTAKGSRTSIFIYYFNSRYKMYTRTESFVLFFYLTLNRATCTYPPGKRLLRILLLLLLWWGWEASLNETTRTTHVICGPCMRRPTNDGNKGNGRTTT